MTDGHLTYPEILQLANDVEEKGGSERAILVVMLTAILMRLEELGMDREHLLEEMR